MSYRYPLHRSNDRRLPQDYSGDVLIWDIDKTYLNTHFSTWRGLFAIPFEFAVDKEALPGAVPLLHALRHGPEKEARVTPLYFVSASPPQLRPVVERKMVLDGVEFDGITFKDQLKLLAQRKFHRLRNQTGYKLTALLLMAKDFPEQVHYLMFGDDAEADADIFWLFSEICAGLRSSPLERQLKNLGADKQDSAKICRLAEHLPREKSVVQIYVHLTRRTPLSKYERFEGRVIATQDFFEQALHLAHIGRIRVDDASKVGLEMIRRGVARDIVIGRLEGSAVRFDLAENLVSKVMDRLRPQSAADAFV